MKTLKFDVTRRMDAPEQSYRRGDTREFPAAEAVDAVALVRSGALVPANKETEEAMAKIMGEADDAGVGETIVGGEGAASPASSSGATVTNAAKEKQAAKPKAPARAAAPAKSKAAPPAPRIKADVTKPPAGGSEGGSGEGGEDPATEAERKAAEEAAAKAAAAGAPQPPVTTGRRR